MSAPPVWPEVISWTCTELRETLEVIDSIALTDHDEAVLEILEYLVSLEAGRPAKLRRRSGGVPHLNQVELREVFLRGISPDGAIRHADRYERQLHSFRMIAWKDRVAFDVMRTHSMWWISEGRSLPDDIRIFIRDFLSGEYKSPRRRGRPSIEKTRNRLIHALILTVSDQFALHPTRNDFSSIGDFSACDAVAESFKRLNRAPRSYKAVKRIWLEISREEASRNTSATSTANDAP